MKGSPTAARVRPEGGMAPIPWARVSSSSQVGVWAGASSVRRSGGAHSRTSPVRTARSSKSGSEAVSGSRSSTGAASVTRSSPRRRSTDSAAQGYWPSASAPCVAGRSPWKGPVSRRAISKIPPKRAGKGRYSLEEVSARPRASEWPPRGMARASTPRVWRK